MTNQLNMLFNQELCNESQYINSHPFSSINMSLGGEVRYIAPIWPWNAPKFQVLDWRLQPPPRRVPGNTKHDQGTLFQLPPTWGDSTNATWGETQKPPPVFPFTRTGAPRDNLFSSKGDARMTDGAARLRTSQSGNSNQSRAPTRDSERPPMESRGGRWGAGRNDANQRRQGHAPEPAGVDAAGPASDQRVRGVGGVAASDGGLQRLPREQPLGQPRSLQHARPLACSAVCAR